MDVTRIHLIITHLPVFGLFLGFFALLYGFLRKDKGVKIVSLAIIFVSMAGGEIAFQTGESAEHAVDNIAAVSHDAVELHEESAELANVFVIALGLLALVGLYMEVKSKRFAKQVILLLLVLSVLSFYFIAQTALLGGKIRHTEISNVK
ncbi:MAG: hypothetical protein M3Y60_04070 [Bacteroidota bacterium]|nr:hypothetical protein [Bacteroidota bacterium]